MAILQPYLAILLPTVRVSFIKLRFRRSFWGALRVWILFGTKKANECFCTYKITKNRNENIRILYHNFWTNQYWDPLSTSKWLFWSQFCERWTCIWQKRLKMVIKLSLKSAFHLESEYIYIKRTSISVAFINYKKYTNQPIYKHIVYFQICFWIEIHIHKFYLQACGLRGQLLILITGNCLSELPSENWWFTWYFWWYFVSVSICKFNLSFH